MPYPDFLYENRGDGTFEDRSLPAWRRNPSESMGAAYADYDNDGQVDLVVGQWDLATGSIATAAAPVSAPTGSACGLLVHAMSIEMQSVVGSILELDDGRTLMQEVKIGSSFGAGNDTTLHFGLDDAAIENLTVVWPNGWKSRLEDVEVNQIHSIRFGQDALRN